MFLPLKLPSNIEPWMVQAYPLVLALLLASYGLQFRHPFSVLIAVLVCLCGVTRGAAWVYLWLRQRISGLDYLALSLGVFFIALGISLSKSGTLRQWWLARRREVPEVTDA
jgi:hypothetical protein